MHLTIDNDVWPLANLKNLTHFG